MENELLNAVLPFLPTTSGSILTLALGLMRLHFSLWMGKAKRTEQMQITILPDPHKSS